MNVRDLFELYDTIKTGFWSLATYKAEVVTRIEFLIKKKRKTGFDKIAIIKHTEEWIDTIERNLGILLTTNLKEVLEKYDKEATKKLENLLDKIKSERTKILDNLKSKKVEEISIHDIIDLWHATSEIMNIFEKILTKCRIDLYEILDKVDL